MIRIAKGDRAYCEAFIQSLKARVSENDRSVEDKVAEILKDVRDNGDEAVRRYTMKFDGWAPEKAEITKEEIDALTADCDPAFIASMERAAENIRAFHARQKQQSRIDPSPTGVLMGQRVRGLHRVGVYVPGGTAAYPSSVLMNVIPAKIAEVGEIVMVTPPGRTGKPDKNILAAARIAGVDRVFLIGGAQAVAALAYGTETVPKVDKVVGPGNIFVATAKKLLYGTIDIDMIAGPSEILVIADKTAKPEFLAADLMSQAEHDRLASAVLLTDSWELAQAVAWSPSLSAAVENDYVQPIGQSQTVNGVTATVEYVIVDRKQLNIFYTLDYAPDLGPMWADCRITPGDGSAGDAGGRTEKPGELVEIKRDFVDRDVPGILDLTLSVYPAEQDGGGPPAENTGDGYFDQPVDDQPAYLAEMTFHLEFDPYFTAQGTLLELNRTFALDGQTFTLQEAEIYPTHLRLTLTADPDNTAWLAGLDLYLENEHGERFEKSLGGITASGDPEGEGMGTFWLDSPFFSQGEHLTLHITGVRWKDKDAPPVKLNLAEGTAENLPEGTWFQGA